jgi:hypothetical protein
MSHTTNLIGKSNGKKKGFVSPLFSAAQSPQMQVDGVANREEPVAQQDDHIEDDDGNDYYDQYIALSHDDGGFMDPIW